MGTKELTVAASEAEVQAIEDIATQCSLEKLGAVGAFRRTFLLAAAINALRSAMTPKIMRELMMLQGSPLGFRTDKDGKGGYHEEVVKECAIEVVLRGGNWTGNEFNIIADRAYFTKEFFTRKVREFPGLKNLKHFPGVPQMNERGALVPYTLTYELNGEQKRFDRRLTKIEGGDIDERICVKVNSGMGTDAVLGKAERKILAALYKELSNMDLGDGDADELNMFPRAGMQQSSPLEVLTHSMDRDPSYASQMRPAADGELTEGQRVLRQMYDQRQQSQPAKEPPKAAPAPAPEPPKPPPEPTKPELPLLDMEGVKAKFDACTKFGDIGQVAKELRPITPESQKHEVAALDELARSRVRAELARRNRG